MAASDLHALLAVLVPPPEGGAKSAAERVLTRVSSKRSKFFFGSNRNKPKLNLFRLFFGLFRETKKQFFRFVSVFRTGIETTETNRTFSKQTETNRKNPKKRTL
jgi:hypothetical protein